MKVASDSDPEMVERVNNGHTGISTTRGRVGQKTKPRVGARVNSVGVQGLEECRVWSEGLGRSGLVK